MLLLKQGFSLVQVIKSNDLPLIRQDESISFLSLTFKNTMAGGLGLGGITWVLCDLEGPF